MAKKEGSFAGWLQRVRKTGEHSDVTVRIQGQEFRLHMLPLVNESTYFRNLSEKKSSSSSDSTSSTSSSSHRHHKIVSRVVEIDDLPGGSEAFSIAADFCYIVRPSYTFNNIAPVRAAAEFLGMHDLVENTKKFLYANVFSSWRSCVSYLREFQRVYPSTDAYIESRTLRVICAACTKAFHETKHVSVPICFSVTTSSNNWNSSPSHTLKDILVAVTSLPDLYAAQLLDMLVDADTNLNIKCRQSRNVREWLDYLIKTECKSTKSRVWMVLYLSRMLLKGAPEQRPCLELSSQYWCSLLEHAGILLAEAEEPMTEMLLSIKKELEHRIGASLHELDDYIQAYSFEPDTLLSLVRHFMAEVDGENQGQAEIEAVASEVDGCLWAYAESGCISIDTFIALEEAFSPGMRGSHDTLYAAVERILDKRKVAEADLQRLLKPVDCSKLSTAVYDKAMSNPSYVSQPHVLECVLRRHSQELADDDRQTNLSNIMQKVITASLKLLEENSRRSKEIMELQKQYASLVGSGFKVHPSQDSCENSPVVFKAHVSHEEILGIHH